MKRILLLMLPAISYSQCPTAQSSTATMCTYTQSAWYSKPAKLTPTITGSLSGATYTWTCPPTATRSGEYTGTLTTNVPGEYTLTVSHITMQCHQVTTHTVYGCPDNINPVGVEEYEISEPVIYRDLFGNVTEFKPGVILIEWRGNRYRKCLSEPPQ